MRRFIGAALAAWLLTGVVGAQSGAPAGNAATPAATKLVLFTSAAGGFTVLAPSGMKENEIPVPVLRVILYSGKDDFLHYNIHATFFPVGARMAGSVSDWFDENDKRTRKEMKADIVLKKNFYVDGFPARETHFLSKDKKKLFIRQAIQADGRRFSLSIETTPEQANRPEIRAFFDSFKMKDPTRP